MKWFNKMFDNFFDFAECNMIAAALAGAMLGTTIAVLLFLFVGV
jgi:hypothetical protein